MRLNSRPALAAGAGCGAVSRHVVVPVLAHRCNTIQFSKLRNLSARVARETLSRKQPQGLYSSRSRGTVRIQALFEQFTERSIKSVMIAQQEAKWLGASEVNSEHILLGLVAEDETQLGKGYLNCGLTSEKAKTAVEALTGKRQAVVSSETIVFSRGVRRAFEIAANECKKSGVSYISPEHILLALLSIPDSTAKKVLASVNVDCEVLKAEARKRLKGDMEAENPPPKKKTEDKVGTKTLDELCKDLCAAAKAGKIDPVIGRSREVVRLVQILGRRYKNNPMLLGDPGVGKTAIAEGLALAIVSRTNPDGSPLPTFLHDKRVMQLDIGRLLAGAKERGELEQRMTKLIAETKAAGNVILMIDEIHTIVGAGSGGRGGGGLDVANLVKPALARGEFQVIGATTMDEFRKYVERDAALERRFQPVQVREPTERETLEILNGLRERYERHHKCVYTEEALEAAVRLSHKYIADRFLPDKAIDLLDEAGSRARITAHQARRTNAKLESPKVQEYMQVLETMNEAVKDELFEEAAILRRRQTDYRAELTGPASSGSSLPVVDTEDIEHIVALWTGIPVENMGQDEKHRLVKLSSVLKEHVIGQDEAVDCLASAIMRARCGLKDPNRPIASLLFVGPTGVGKTEVARVLAEQYFGSRDAMIRLDMSEYMERHSVSKLIGAPPGYIGYGDGGKLTEAVRRRPCCLILLDEVEKAHPDVFNILLQVLEDGRLSDSTGRTVSFKNALVVLTSNIGSRLIAGSGGPGLAARSRRNDADDDAYEAEAGMESETSSASVYSRTAISREQRERDAEADPEAGWQRGRLRETVMEELRQFFRPELLNRLDEQVVFQKLGRAEVRTIAGLLVEETVARVAERGFVLQLSQRLVDQIIREGYSDEYGVRPLRQTFVRYIEDSLSDTILKHNVQAGSSFMMDLVPGTRDVAVTYSPLQGASPVAGDAAVVQQAVVLQSS